MPAGAANACGGVLCPLHPGPTPGALPLPSGQKGLYPVFFLLLRPCCRPTHRPTHTDTHTLPPLPLPREESWRSFHGQQLMEGPEAATLGEVATAGEAGRWLASGSWAIGGSHRPQDEFAWLALPTR